MPLWWNGRHCGLKIHCFGVRVRIPPGVPYFVRKFLMNIRLAALPKESVVDGEGLRLAIFVQGCSIKCKGCHNPKAQDPNKGVDFPINSIARYAADNPIISGITISGGEPFDQKEKVLELIEQVKHLNPNLDVWVYTGYLFEDLLKTDKDILEKIDVLVDGPFIADKKSLDLKFRGSSNQRIIHVKNCL